MKINFVVVTLLLYLSVGQSQTITYVNNRTEFQTINDTFLGAKINEIILRDDFTFQLEQSPLIARRSWSTYTGTWSRSANKIILYDQYRVYEPQIRFLYPESGPQDYYEFELKTDRGSRLKHRTVEIGFVYDFYAKLESVKRVYRLDENNKVRIPMDDIPHHRELASFEIDYHLKGEAQRRDYVCSSPVVNERGGELPTRITVVITKKPIVETVDRTITAEIEDGKLRVIEQLQGKTTMLDKLEYLEFEAEYTLKE
ncbi:MAG: hypothetical protein AAFW73_25370 [Bacteroidota bacterium]